MAHESPGLTLEPTALVHEAYLRLVGDEDPGWNGRRHFFGAAARAMRRILVERARRVGREKHGGGRDRVPLDEALGEVLDGAAEADGRVLDLDAALEELAALDPRAAEIAQLRFFAGLDADETAAALEVSERTVRREWAFAKSWLSQKLGEGPPPGEESQA